MEPPRTGRTNTIESVPVPRRIEHREVVQWQIDRICQLASERKSIGEAVEALEVLCVPYMRDHVEWVQRWDAREVTGFRTQDGRDTFTPTIDDHLRDFRLLMELLTEAGVVVERRRVFHVS